MVIATAGTTTYSMVMQIISLNKMANFNNSDFLTVKTTVTLYHNTQNSSIFILFAANKILFGKVDAF